MSEVANLKTIETLDRSPFKYMVATIGNLPTSFVDSMSYYECIAWLVKYLETEVIPTVNNNAEAVAELQAAYIQLKEFVDNYFENLDVQEEINNKLDEMAEAGTLTDIIAGYIQLKGILAYDTVADLKAATNVADGSFAETYGFYEKGDGGGAKYKIRAITNDDTIDESTIIEITADPTNTLIAELIMSAEMTVKQFGCTGDGETDETNKFNKAIANCKKLYVNAGTYILNRFLPEENQEIIGIGEAIIKVNGTTAPLVYLKSNSRLENLDIRSLKENLEWNRCDISEKTNVVIENCKISGFRHNNQFPNAWGILVTRSTDVTIRNCYFDNNTQSDIAVVENTHTLTIDGCRGTEFKINFEPNNGQPISDVVITNCNMYNIKLLENDLLTQTIKDVTISSCTIGTLYYDGAAATFINCRISNFAPSPQGGYCYGGNLKFINSAQFSKNLFNDPYFDTLKNDGAEWSLSYTPVAWNTVVNAVSDIDGRCIVLNESNTSTSVSLKHADISVTAGQTYLYRVNSKEKTLATGTGYASVSMQVRFYDANNDEVPDTSLKYSINRHPANMENKMEEVSAIIRVPEGASKMRIIVMNSSYGSQSVTIRSAELYEISGNEYGSINLPSLPVRRKRIFTNSALPANNGIPYEVGDTMYYATPSTYIGAVCTVAGRVGTWKNFGEIAA